MKCHFIILVAGTVLFLICLLQITGRVMVSSSVAGEAAAENSSSLISALQIAGMYIAFVALLIGHAVLIVLPKLTRAGQA